MITFLKKNIDSYLLFILMFLMPLGSKFNVIDLGLLNLFAYRIVLLLAFGYLLYKRKIWLSFDKINKWLMFFIFYILSFGLVSLIWVENKIFAITQISYLFWGVITFFVFISLFKTINRPFKIMVAAIIAILMVLFTISIFEIHTSAHFYSSFLNRYENQVFIRTFFYSPLATFSNPNDFATFLVFSFPFLILFYQNSKYRIFAVLMLLLNYFICRFTFSNLSALSYHYYIVVIAFLIIYSHNYWLISKIRRILGYSFSYVKRNYLNLSLASIVVITSFIYITYSNNIFMPFKEDKVVLYEIKGKNQDVFNMKFEAERKSEITNLYNNIIEVVSEVNVETKIDSISHEKIEIVDVPIVETGSYKIRHNMFFNGLEFAKDSYFLGFGAGQFTHKLQKGEGKYPTKTISDPHNFVVEVLTQYGIIPLLFLIVFLIKLAFLVLKNFKFFYNQKPSDEALIILLIAPTFLIMSNSMSSYLSHPMVWFIYAVLVYSTYYLHQRVQNKG
jgi:teichuronic acid biosynthesis protein TuaE